MAFYGVQISDCLLLVPLHDRRELLARPCQSGGLGCFWKPVRWDRRPVTKKNEHVQWKFVGKLTSMTYCHLSALLMELPQSCAKPSICRDDAKTRKNLPQALMIYLLTWTTFEYEWSGRLNERPYRPRNFSLIYAPAHPALDKSNVFNSMAKMVWRMIIWNTWLSMVNFIRKFCTSLQTQWSHKLWWSVYVTK